MQGLDCCHMYHRYSNIDEANSSGKSATSNGFIMGSFKSSHANQAAIDIHNCSNKDLIHRKFGCGGLNFDANHPMNSCNLMFNNINSNDYQMQTCISNQQLLLQNGLNARSNLPSQESQTPKQNFIPPTITTKSYQSCNPAQFKDNICFNDLNVASQPSAMVSDIAATPNFEIITSNGSNILGVPYARFLANHPQPNQYYCYDNNNTYNNNKYNSLPKCTALKHTATPATPNHSPTNSELKTQNHSVPDKQLTMDAREIANFLATELFMQQLVSVDGIQSGVPTNTTPTLTPTTLRSIEDTFIEMTSEPSSVPFQAGFIPPKYAATSGVAAQIPGTIVYNSGIQDFNGGFGETESEDSQGSGYAHLNEENSVATTDNSSTATDSCSFQNGLNGLSNNSLATSNTSSTNDFSAVNIAFANAAGNNGLSLPTITSTPNAKINNKNTSTNSGTPSVVGTTRRNQGGRRPAKSFNISPEEEEKRRLRRERNKLAAARCRKRRVDQTNELLEEVAVLEKKREGLQKEIEQLTADKNSLEFALEAHHPSCQKLRIDQLGAHVSLSNFSGLIDSNSGGTNTEALTTNMDPSLAATGRSISPIDLKPVIHPGLLEIVNVKNEPLEDALDSGSSLDDTEGPTPSKRALLTGNNPMIPPPLPNVATLSPQLAAASASLNTPLVTTPPVTFSFSQSVGLNNNNLTLNVLNTRNMLNKNPNGSKQRPNSLPNVPRSLAQNLGLNVDGKAIADINGVVIQTPSTGTFNFESLMDGGTGLTPVQCPLPPNSSSQSSHLELTTPTSEPSRLVSL